jgi:CHAT domain-containing protein
MRFTVGLFFVFLITSQACAESRNDRTKKQVEIQVILQRLNGLEAAHDYQLAYSEAEKLKAAILHNYGAEHVDYAMALNHLASLMSDAQGRDAEAEKLLQQAVTIYQNAIARKFGSPFGLRLLLGEAIGRLALNQVTLGKYVDAEANYRVALQAFEEAIRAPLCAGRSPAPMCATIYQDWGGTLNNLGTLLELEQRFDEAEGVYGRALEVFRRRKSPGLEDIAYTGDRLATNQRDQGKYTEAELLQRQVLEICEREIGPDNVVTSYYRSNLGTIKRLQKQFSEAETIHRAALAVFEKVAPGGPNAAESSNELGLDFQALKKYSEAEKQFNHAFELRQRMFGPTNPKTLKVLDNLARLYIEVGDAAKALDASRKLSALQIERSGVANNAGAQSAPNYFRTHIDAIALMQSSGGAAALDIEAFEMAQRAADTSTAEALRQIDARFAAGSGPLSGLVRESQNLAADRVAKEKLLNDALSQDEDRQEPQRIRRLRNDLDSINKRQMEVNQELAEKFPEYSSLTRTKPLAPSVAQALLGNEEAAIFFISSEKKSYVFALTKEAMVWKTIPIGKDELSRSVLALREGLDFTKYRKAIAAHEEPVLFDLDRAYDLYALLIKPIESVIKEKPEWLIAPTAATTAIPFQALLTDHPSQVVRKLADTPAYASAPWVMKSHAVTILPSVASLATLRGLREKERASEQLIGFGDPIFNEKERQKAIEEIKIQTTRTSVDHAYTDFWKGINVDYSNIYLQPLFETADELRIVARILGANDGDLYLEKQASETNVKKLPLKNYRVVYFATHGLVAGDIRGLGEPSLALTFPPSRSFEDDGLLTAGEVAQLDLNADWVVLSACNTVSGERPGADGLSGLAKAFLYAGARAVLATQWSVDTVSVVQLAAMTIGFWASDPKTSRSEALRRSMLFMLQGKSFRGPPPYDWVNPIHWAPFEVIGEGRSQLPN